MSSYVSRKAIRYKFKEPLSEERREELWDKYFFTSLKKDYNLKHEMKYAEGYDYDPYKEENYLDIIIKETYDTICGDFGSSREVTDEEVAEYLADFQKVIPTATKEDLRYVFYCYYNGTDAPCCYDVGEWDD